MKKIFTLTLCLFLAYTFGPEPASKAVQTILKPVETVQESVSHVVSLSNERNDQMESLAAQFDRQISR